jgi:predicted AAA+ superfamily ATPase
MKRRNLTNQLLTALRDTSVVYLQGPRQAGKSTLAHALQQEVDFVLEDARGRLVGIEVKKTASPTSGDFKGLRHLSEQTGKKFLRGILLYTGSTSVAFEPNLHAVPVSALWQLEAKLTEP